MIRTSAATIALFVTALPALANATLQDFDISGDNFASYEEVRNVIPEIDRVDFRAMDTNGDRRLSSAEINAEEAQTRLSQHSMRALKDRPLALIDVDGDGFMSFEDVARVHPGLTTSAFSSIDSNGDNRLSVSEYYADETQTALAQCAESTFIDMADMDTNGDNFLSMEELKGGYPSATAADFRTVDLNSDNRISAVELLAPTAECLSGKN